MLVVKINYEGTDRHFSVRGVRDECIKQRRPAAKTRTTYVRKRSSVTGAINYQNTGTNCGRNNPTRKPCQPQMPSRTKNSNTAHPNGAPRPTSQPVSSFYPIPSHQHQIIQHENLVSLKCRTERKMGLEHGSSKRGASTNHAASQVHPIPSQRPISTQ